MISVQNVVRTYGSGTAAVPVLKGISLEIATGECVSLLGRSGSGKSTLLNLLSGMDRIDGGEIVVDGRALSRMDPREKADYRLRTIGMVFQSFYLIPGRTALENVELPLIFAGMPRKERRKLARESIAQVGLTHREDQMPTTLSGGERQRVAIARALINRPNVLLADEPTGNLDTSTGQEIMALLLERMRRDNGTLVLVTHDEELARTASGRIFRMQDGVLVR